MLFVALALANCKFVVAITSCQLYDNKRGRESWVGQGRGGRKVSEAQQSLSARKLTGDKH